MTVLGIILTAIGALTFAFPLWKPENVRRGELVKRKGKGKNDSVQIQEALRRVNKPYFWTDSKIYLLGSAFTVVGVFLLIIGIFDSQ